MKSYYDEDYDDRGNQVGERYDVHDCPFCGSKNTDLYQTQVKCERCDAHGPDVVDDQWPMAITLWNELPRRQGDELKQLRSRWSNMMRRARLAHKKALARVRKEEASGSKEWSEWAREREAWLRSPIDRDFVNGN